MLRKSVLLGIGIISVVGVLSVAQVHSDDSYGHGGGNGMMGGGSGNNSGHNCPYANGVGSTDRTATKEDVQRIAERKLNWYNNDKLKVGTIDEKKDTFFVTIVTKKEGAMVDSFSIDKKTGRFNKN